MCTVACNFITPDGNESIACKHSVSAGVKDWCVCIYPAAGKSYGTLDSGNETCGRPRWKLNGMKKSIALISNGVAIAVIGLMLIAFPSSSVSAKQPPYRGCVAISKGEYQGARKKKMLRTRFGTYVRTGRLWRRYYWYCR